MTHLPALISDLCVILVTAAGVTLIFRKLKQPVVLGYLIAGMLVGPHFTLLPTVQDTKSITIWAEIGVIFLLFGLGLEFSFKKLFQVGKSAAITAVVEVLALLGLGYVLGRALGWSTMDSVFLGGILSISSTTIIVRAFEELGLKNRKFVSIVYGVLIIEDLIAILLLVLLTSVAVSQSLSGQALAVATGRLGFFLVLGFVLGIYGIPTLLKRLRSLLTDETMLLVSIGLCLLLVTLSSAAGFSPALGAFVMGSLLAETPDGKRIEHLLVPVKNLFSAIFFVSVGMLLDPSTMVDSGGIILLIAGITIVGKLLSSAGGALLAGVPLRDAVQTGMSLAQIGEFSFIIATLGMSLGVTSAFLYPIAVAVSALTTFTTPYLIRASAPTLRFLERRLPVALQTGLARYASSLQSPSSIPLPGVILREFAPKLVINTVLILAISAVMKTLLLRVRPDATLAESLAAATLTLVICGPFFWAICFGRLALSKDTPAEVKITLGRIKGALFVIRMVWTLALLGIVLSAFTSILIFSGALAAAVIIVVLIFGRYAGPIYERLENQFLSNFSARERELISERPALAPWNATLAELTVSSDSPLVAKTLADSKLKDQFGLTLTLIERGSQRILAPKRDELLLPGDRLFLIGTDEQLEAARPEIETPSPIVTSTRADGYGLFSQIIKDGDAYAERTIRECGIRENLGGLIVGLERKGERILSPAANTRLQAGDVLWIVGTRP